MSFTRAQGSIVGDGLCLLTLIPDRAVIREEEHDRVRRLTRVIERFHELSHGIVGAFHHRAVNRIDVAGIPLAVLGDHLFPRFQRDGYREIRLIKKDWRLVVAGDGWAVIYIQALV